MGSTLLARSALWLSMLWPLAAFAAVTPYPPYPGAKPSPAFQVTVDGQPVFVHRFLTYDQFQFMDYASFSMTGKVQVTVTNLVGEMDVLSCDIRPLVYGIKPQMSGNTCSFELDRPRYLLVFPNEMGAFGAAGLMLFAEPPEKNPPKPGDPNVVNILDYKVDNTGKTVETATINRAIGEVAARPGGGVLFFPAGGVYMTGTLLMKSNVRLYIDAGALIKGTGKMADYTSAPAPPGQPPRTRPLRAQVIFDHVENAGLTGRGAIDMDGYPKLWYDFAPDTADGRARNEDGIVKDPHGAGARGYVIDNCRNITFQDLLLLRSAEWTVHVIDTENFTTRNIKIVNRKRQHHDDIYDLTGSSQAYPDRRRVRHGHGRYLGAVRQPGRRGHGPGGYRGEGIRELHLRHRRGDRVWQSRFGQAPALRGRTLRQQHRGLRRLVSTCAAVLDGTGVSRGPRNRQTRSHRRCAVCQLLI